MTSSAVRRKFQVFLIPALAVVTALLVGAIIMLIFGDNPIAAYRGLFEGAFGSPRNWAETVRRMTPLILTGLSVAVAFKAGLFNIGASGQFIMGTVFSVAVGVNFEGPPHGASTCRWPSAQAFWAVCCGARFPASSRSTPARTR